MANPDEQSVLGLYQAKHVFVELHEFRRDHWHEIRRWNHGLQEHLERKSVHDGSDYSQWTRPHLPSISLFGMMALRESLTADMMVMDVYDEDQTLSPIVDSMVNQMAIAGTLARDKQEFARGNLMSHLTKRHNAIVARHRNKAVATVSASLNTGMWPGSTDMVRQRSWDSGLSNTDALMPDADEEAVHILVDVVDWLEVDVVFFARMLEAVETGLEEQTHGSQPRARFIMVILGPPHPTEPRRHVEIGEAAAALLQDDRIVTIAYNATDPCEIVAAFEERFRQLRLMPDTTRPTPAGFKKRATRMLEQMESVKNEKEGTDGTLRRSQTQKWYARQTEGFQDGVSVNSFLAVLQKYALPLLAGIAVALILANGQPSFYERWFGYEHGDAGHGAGEDHDAAHKSGSDYASESHPTMFGFSLHGHKVTLHFIVNDICMCLFFGLAAKEITEALQPGGSLYPPTRTTVNVLAATIGGVAGPIIVYILALAVLTSLGMMDDTYTFADYAIGWGIPTATDISLAWVTALCVFGAGHPAINYLLLLAIVDDGIGLLIIAFAYPDPSSPVQPFWLLLCVFASIIAYTLRRLRCSSWKLYISLAGPVSWFGLLYANLHPSLALVFVVPFIPMHITNENLDLTWLTSKAAEHPGGHQHKGQHDAPLHEFEEAVKNFVDFVVLFAFGTCNAGVKVDSIGPLTWVTLFSLVCGKMLGISGASSFATCCGCPPPKGMGTSSVVILGFIASAGLTVALFVSGEAFSQQPDLAAQAKMGALFTIGVAVSAIVCSAVARKMGYSIQAQENEAPKVGLVDNLEEDDEALEDVVVGDHVRGLHVRRQAQQHMEHKVDISRKEVVTRIQRSSSKTSSLPSPTADEELVSENSAPARAGGARGQPQATPVGATISI